MFYIAVKSSVCIKFLQANGIEELGDENRLLYKSCDLGICSGVGLNQYQIRRCPTTSPFTNMYHTIRHKKGFCQIFEYIDMQ